MSRETRAHYGKFLSLSSNQTGANKKKKTSLQHIVIDIYNVTLIK